MTESVTAAPRGTSAARRALSAFLVSASVALCLTAPAAAQNFGATFFDDDILPPRVIAWRLADRGFSNVSRPRFDGRVYVVDAVGPAGLPVRLILDPASGAIIDRQRPPGTETYARLERPPVRSMPGYGWTEDDVTGARPGPQPMPRPLPPESFPAPHASRPVPRDAARPGDPNPLGLNPDGNRRTETPRRVARTAPTAPSEKPSLSRVSPLAPAPKAARTEPASPPAAAKTDPASEPAPAPAEKEATAPAEKPVAQAAPKPEWRDPPEGKRPVRVIGGATIVPGTGDKAGEPAQPSQ